MGMLRVATTPRGHHFFILYRDACTELPINCQYTYQESDRCHVGHVSQRGVKMGVDVHGMNSKGGRGSFRVG
jgi:hypothetical protein